MINIIKQSENLFIINNVKFRKVTNFFMPMKDLYCIFDGMENNYLFGKITSYYPLGFVDAYTNRKCNFTVLVFDTPGYKESVLDKHIIKVGGKEILEDMVFL